MMTVFTDLVTVAPAVLLLIIIVCEEFSPAQVVHHVGVIQLVGLAGVVVLKPSEAQLGALFDSVAEGAAGCGDNDPIIKIIDQ